MYTDCNYKETTIEQVGKGCDEMMNAMGIIEMCYKADIMADSII